jgi:hypothetical protein
MRVAEVAELNGSKRKLPETRALGDRCTQTQ